MLQIENITIEGPDLSGKTTLYNNIHKQTNYRWNIQDRSMMSMLAHAIFYDRASDIEKYKRLLEKDLKKLGKTLMIKMLILKWFLTVMLGFIESICELFQKNIEIHIGRLKKMHEIARLGFGKILMFNHLGFGGL